MEVIENKEKNRFETTMDGHLAFIGYSLKPYGFSLNHTEVPDQLAGKGIASKMTEKVLAEIGRRGLKIKPLCPFIKKYIDRHPNWNSIIN